MQYFGVEIDQALGSEEVNMSSAVSSDELPDFDVSSADLVATAQLLLSRKPQLEKLVQRKNYLEMPGLRSHGFSTYDDAELALSRIISIAGTLLKRALAMNEDDVVALNQLAGLYRETGRLESALACDQAAMAICPDSHEIKISAAQSLLALERYEEAIDVAGAAKGIPRNELECIRLVPFREWGESIGEVHAVNAAEPFAYRFATILGGMRTEIDCVIDQLPLYVVHVRDLTVIDGYVPAKGGAGHIYEFGQDVLQWFSQATWKSAFIHKTNKEIHAIEEPCIYLSGAGWHYENYYHALAQNYPRLARLLDCPEYAGFGVAVPASIRPWGLDFLKELGVAADRIVQLPVGQDALLRRAVVPIMRRAASKDEIRALRGRLGTNSRPRGTRRFFVGRRTLPSHPRLLVNEPEIAAIAAEYGFEEIAPAGMSIRQQIELFGQAAAICGPNGAALGNILHAPDGTAVICLSPRETLGSWYADLAALCNQSFCWCFGSFLPEGRSSRQLPKLPFFIDPDDFRQLLEAAVGAGKSEPVA
jgi:tetratricopeptide (TPR) repeat protein